jgi:hypothetical protein
MDNKINAIIKIDLFICYILLVILDFNLIIIMNLYNPNLKLSDIDISKLTFHEDNINRTGTISYNYIPIPENQRCKLDRINNFYPIDSLPLEIKKYCLTKLAAHVYLVNTNRSNIILNLSDFDLTTFQFDKENQKVIINDKSININQIISDEIREYCYNQIYDITNEKDICKYFIESIKHTHCSISLNMEIYNKITTLNHKIYMNKYIFMKYKNVLESDIIKQLLSIYNKHPSLLLDLIKDVIVTKSKALLENILINKEINIKNVEYDKLKDFAINSNSNDLYDILTIYQSLDYLSNDIYFEKPKEKTN